MPSLDFSRTLLMSNTDRVDITLAHDMPASPTSLLLLKVAQTLDNPSLLVYDSRDEHRLLCPFRVVLVLQIV